MGSEANRILLLGQQQSNSTNVVYNALSRSFADVTAVLEEPESRYRFLQRRVDMVGLLPVVGQVLFMGLAMPILRLLHNSRIEEIKRAANLDESPIPGKAVRNVKSVNGDSTREFIRAVAPDVIVVSGTRIIGSNTLEATEAPFINWHAGITPLYRGVHGGYWALVEGRPDLAGTTIHYIDEGIDTGDVLEQVMFEVTDSDSIATYPYLHLAVGLPSLIEVVERAIEGSLVEKEPETELSSQLRLHPTLWGYFKRRIVKGVK